MSQNFTDLANYEKKLIEIIEKLGLKSSKTPYTGSNIRTLWNRISLLKKQIKAEKPNFDFSKLGPRKLKQEESKEETKEEVKEESKKKTPRIDSIQAKFVSTYNKIKAGSPEISEIQTKITSAKSGIQYLETQKAEFLEKINKQIDDISKDLNQLENRLIDLKNDPNIYKPLYDLFEIDNLRALRKRKSTLMYSTDPKLHEVFKEISETEEGQKLLKFLTTSDGLAENIQYRERAENRETIIVPQKFSPENIKKIIKDFTFTDFGKKAKKDPQMFADAQIAIEIALALRRNELEKIEIDYKNNRIGSTKNKPGSENKMWDVKSFLKKPHKAIKIAFQLQKAIKSNEAFYRKAYKDRLIELFGDDAITDFSRLRRIGGTYAAARFMKGLTAKTFANSSKLHDLQQAMRHTKDSSITSVYMNKVKIV